MKRVEFRKGRVAILGIPIPVIEPCPNPITHSWLVDFFRRHELENLNNIVIEENQND